MKLSCEVIEDLLPLYHDKVCSPESSLLVAEHLKECESCKHILSAMEGEIDLSGQTEDKQMLEKLSRNWKKATRKALLRGMALALAAVMVLLATAGGFWYGTQATPYQELAARMEVTAQYPHEAGTQGEPAGWVFPREYSLFRNGYHFWLRLPGLLDFTGGSIAVYPDPAHLHWNATGLRPNVSLGVKLDGSEVCYIIHIDVEDDPAAVFCVDGQLNYIEDKNYGSAEVHLPLLEEYRPEIRQIVQAAKDMWELP